MTDEGDQQNGVKSVETSGLLLSALSEADGPQRISDLARAAGMNPAKAHRYLVSLVRTGLAVQNRDTGLYDLGPVALRMALKALTRFDILRDASESLDMLVQQLGETAALVVWSEIGPKFVRMVEARHSQSGSVPISHICPLTWSATGLLFAAFEEPQRTRPLVAQELEQNRTVGRPDAPRTPAELETILAEIRATGVSTSVDRGRSGFAAVCAPVCDQEGKLVMALSVFGTATRMNVTPESDLLRVVKATADALSDKLSGRAPPGR